MKRIVMCCVLSIVLISTVRVVFAYTNEEECGFCKNPPECCSRIKDEGPHACDWPIRGYCPMDICNQIDGKKERCGWYWIFHDEAATPGLGTNTANGYGCLIGPSESSMRPRCDPTPIPTIPPPPTAFPTSPPPTSKPIPTSEPLPTSPSPIEIPPTDVPFQPVEIPPTIYVPPIELPTSVPTNIPESPYQSQGFSIPLVQIPTIPMVCLNTPSTHDPITYIVDKITYYDHMIENTINIKLLLFYHMVKSKINPQH